MKYYNAYIDFCKVVMKYYQFKYISPMEISDNPHLINPSLYNPYLDSTLSVNLANHIIENGMHLPFIIDEECMIVEGQHRLSALKAINDTNKYLAITADICKVRGKDVSERRTESEVLRVPNKSICGIYLLRAKINQIDEDWVEVTFADTRSLIYAFISFGIWLRNPIFAWESLNGTLRGHELINERFK